MKLVQTYLAQAGSLAELDLIIDKFLKDKKPEDIITTDLAITNSPYDQMKSVYTAMIIYKGLNKEDLLPVIDNVENSPEKRKAVHSLIIKLFYLSLFIDVIMLILFIQFPELFKYPLFTFISLSAVFISFFVYFIFRLFK